MKEFKLNINGLDIIAKYDDNDINKVFIPVINEIKKINKNERKIIYLVAPPGSGKTTLATFLEKLSNNEMQSIGIDGFHYSKNYLQSNYCLFNNKKVLMNDIKGNPQTFDIDKLLHYVKLLKNECIKWPIYDRNIHDVIDNAITINKDIVIIEGNWLLLNEGKFSLLKNYCDLSIFIQSDLNLLINRLIERKMMGKFSKEEAKKFVYFSDLPNIQKVQNNSFEANIILKYKNNKYERVK